MLARTTDALPLAVLEGRLRWAGPLMEDAPLVAVEIDGPWAAAAAARDVLGLDAPPCPIPAGLWAALADRCVDAPGVIDLLYRGGPTTPGWRDALRRAALQRGLAAERPAPGDAEVLDDGARVQSVGRLGGRVVALRDGSLRVLDGEIVALPPGPGHQLLRPLGPSDGAALARTQGPSVSVTRILEDGSLSETRTGVGAGTPVAFACRDDRWWLVTSTAVCALPPAGGPPEAPIPWGRTPLFPSPEAHGDWLVLPGPTTFVPSQGWLCDQIVWVHLVTGETRAVPWVRGVAHRWHDGALWLAGDQGVWRLQPGGGGAQIEAEPAYDLRFHEGARWVAGPTSRRDGVPVDLPTTYHLAPLPGGMAWNLLDGVALQWGGRDERWATRGEFSSALRGDVAAVAHGGRVAILGTEGARGIHQLGDGVLLGSLAAGFVFGPLSGGRPPTACTELVVLGSDGRSTDSLRAQGRWNVPRLVRWSDGGETDQGLLDGDHVLLTGEGRTGRWEPRPRPSLPAAPEPSRRAGERVHGFHTSNPRDDWGVPGLDLPTGLHLVEDGRYAGTTGVCPATGLQLGEGATVVAARCHFAGGLTVARGAVAWLIDCTVEGAIVVDPSGALITL